MALTIKAYALLILFLFFIAGCSPTKTHEEILASVQEHIQNKNYNTAIIELKNIIQLDVSNWKARLLLGDVYLSSGHAINAQKEFEKAEEYGADPNEFYPALARALYLQSNSEDVLNLDLNVLENNEAKSALLYYQGIASYQLGDKSTSEEMFNKSQEASSQVVFGKLSESYSYILQNKMHEALSAVNHLLSTHPENLDAISLKARLLFNNKSYTEALSLFEKYSVLQPNDLQSFILLAYAYVKNSEFEKAEVIADRLLKIAPPSAILNQIKGVSRYHHQDFEGASMFLGKAIQNDYITPETLFLAGVSEYQQKNFEQAYSHLIKIEGGLSSSHPAKKLLSILRIKLGYTAEVEESFIEFEDLTVTDTTFIHSASYELLKVGDTQRANLLLDKSISLKSDKVEDILRQGILRLTMKDIEGISDLENVILMEPENEVANAVLADAYLSNGQYKKALKLAHVLQGKGNIAGFNLAGATYLKLKDMEKAEDAYTTALNQNKTNTASLMFFIRKSLSNKNTAEALNYLSTILLIKPKYFPALKLNYFAHKQKGDTQPALTKMEQLVENNPNSYDLRLQYAQLLAIDKQPQKVITLLTSTSIDEKNVKNSYYWQVLGDSYIVNNQLDKAFITFDSWTKKKPQDKKAWFRKISVSDMINDYASALKTTQKALTYAKNDQSLRLIETYYFLKEKMFDEAEFNLNEYFSLEDKKKRVEVQSMLGQVQLGKRQFTEANITLLALYEKSKDLQSLGLVFESYLGMKKRADGDAFLMKHINDFPSDIFAMILLADSQFNNAPDNAIDLYQSIISISPANLLAINNLAYLKSQKGLLTNADDIIQKGLVIYPDSAVLLDTAAVIREKLGNIASAKQLSKKANKLSPENTAIEINFNRINGL
jgi:putative PEP-CTERM system TPR-repeat lipoprotein